MEGLQADLRRPMLDEYAFVALVFVELAEALEAVADGTVGDFGDLEA